MKPKIYTLRFHKINRDIFLAIRSGRKRVETRAATIQYRKIQDGDTVIFLCGKASFSKRINKATHFASVAAMLKKYKIKDIHPDMSSSKELRAMYETFLGYREKIKKYGFIVLEL